MKKKLNIRKKFDSIIIGIGDDLSPKEIEDIIEFLKKPGKIKSFGWSDRDDLELREFEEFEETDEEYEKRLFEIAINNAREYQRLQGELELKKQQLERYDAEIKDKKIR